LYGKEVILRERKYIQFLQDFDFPRERERYIKDVKYRVVEETTEKYMVSKAKNIGFSKLKEGEQFIIGRI
jgi:hypothetical protein